MSTIFLFWSNPPSFKATYSEWVSQELIFSQLHILSLSAHQKVGNRVVLYTYQRVNQWPFCDVELRDANDIYPSELAFAALQLGHSIAHISDLVRLSAAAQKGGIVLDMDAVVLRKFPDIPSFFCTMPAKRKGQLAPQWGPKKPPMKVHDGSWDGKELTAFPIKIRKELSLHVKGLVNKINLSLSKPPKSSGSAWNYVLWTVKDIARIDTKAKIYQPIYTCPVPSWLFKGKCYSLTYPSRMNGQDQIFGYTLPSVEEILSRSFCVQHFFESAFQNAPLKDSSFFKTVHPNSLLGQECRQVFGENWRKEILSLSLNAAPKPNFLFNGKRTA